MFPHSGLFLHAPAHLLQNRIINQVLLSNQILLGCQPSPLHPCSLCRFEAAHKHRNGTAVLCAVLIKWKGSSPDIAIGNKTYFTEGKLQYLPKPKWAKCSELWIPAHAALSSRLQHSRWAVFSLAEVVRDLVGMHHSLARAADTRVASGIYSIGLDSCRSHQSAGVPS